MSKRLWVVKMYGETYVYAEDYVKAERIASEQIAAIAETDLKFETDPLYELEGLAHGWHDACIPWGGDRTLGELFAEQEVVE